MAYTKRTYRQIFVQKDMVHFQVAYKDTDLDIGIPRVDFGPETIPRAKSIIQKYYRQIEAYIEYDPSFGRSLIPHDTVAKAPKIAKEMAAAARLVNVGPMAAVAGAIAQYTALELAGNNSEIIVENGGDIYLNTCRPRNIGIYAGNTSPFSNRLAIKINPELSPLGICTSSGTVGHALSFGSADAVVIVANSAILADAVATAVGNTVRKTTETKEAAHLAASIPGILGAVIIVGDNLAAWGKISLVRI